MRGRLSFSAPPDGPAMAADANELELGRRANGANGGGANGGDLPVDEPDHAASMTSIDVDLASDRGSASSSAGGDDDGCSSPTTPPSGRKNATFSEDDETIGGGGPPPRLSAKPLLSKRRRCRRALLRFVRSGPMLTALQARASSPPPCAGQVGGSATSAHAAAVTSAHGRRGMRWCARPPFLPCSQWAAGVKVNKNIVCHVAAAVRADDCALHARRVGARERPDPARRLALGRA